MKDSIKSQHSSFNSLFYFLFAEKIVTPLLYIWFTFVLTLAYLGIKYSSGEVREVPIIILFILIGLAIFSFLFIAMFTIFPAYYRGKFLRNDGYCVITPDYIESVCCGKTKRYDYKNRTIKVKKYKDGSTDIFIGKSFIDLIKHGYIVLSPGYFKAMKALIGFGAPLYRVTNADEIIKYLESNK